MTIREAKEKEKEGLEAVVSNKVQEVKELVELIAGYARRHGRDSYAYSWLQEEFERRAAAGDVVIATELYRIVNKLEQEFKNGENKITIKRVQLIYSNMLNES